MNIIYNECLGNKKLIYIAFCEKDSDTHENVYGISVKDITDKREAILRGLTAKKDQIIDFIETLIRNSVKPDFVNDIAEDYLLA